MVSKNLVYILSVLAPSWDKLGRFSIYTIIVSPSHPSACEKKSGFCAECIKLVRKGEDLHVAAIDTLSWFPYFDGCAIKIGAHDAGFIASPIIAQSLGPLHE